MLLTRSHAPRRAASLRRGALPALALLLVFQAPVLAQNGSYVKPGISVGEFFDDNLFMVPGQEPVADLVSRVSPALEVGYRAPRGHLIGTYTFDAEIYPDHQNLNMPFLRQSAGLDLLSQISPRVSFTTVGSYDRTHTPYELNLTGPSEVTSGLAIGRFEADRIIINPQLTTQITGRTKLLLNYRWLRDALGDQPIATPGLSPSFSSWIGDAGARLEHQTTGTTMLGAGYTLRQFGFGDGTRVRSHLLLFGVGHRFSPLTSIEIWAGPRLSPGEVRPEITLALKHQYQRGQLTLNYGQEQGTTLGALTPLDMQTVNLEVSIRTSRLVEIGFGPGFFRTTDHTSNLNLRVYAAGTTLTLHLNQQLSVVMSYNYTRQEGTFVGLDQTLPHQIALVSFTVTPLRGVEF